MTLEQCENCPHFCIEYSKIMGWNYQICKNQKCIDAFESETGVKIEYIKKCPMGKYDPIGPGKTKITSPLDAAFGLTD